MSETIMHPASPDDPYAQIADLENEVASLRAQVESADASKREAIEKLAAAHAAHLESIAHGDCISVSAHKAGLRELRERLGKQ